jgi:hypothetical protein
MRTATLLADSSTRISSLGKAIVPGKSSFTIVTMHRSRPTTALPDVTAPSLTRNISSSSISSSSMITIVTFPVVSPAEIVSSSARAT